MQQPLALGTRGSALALRQAELVRAALRSAGRECEVRVISSTADEYPDRPLTSFPGEGVFVKELEAALLDRRIDAAVHSLKDLPLDMPQGLTVACVLKREEPRDAFVSRSGLHFGALSRGSKVGTSSLRRRSQLLMLRPKRDVELVEIRGNVDTRLRKLDDGQYDAIVLAAAGLIRLGLRDRISHLFDPDEITPEPGQGAIAIQVRIDDDGMTGSLASLDDAPTRACVEAERSFLRALGGGCHLPIGALAVEKQGTLELLGSVTAPDGKQQMRAKAHADAKSAVQLGRKVADIVISQGARDLLK